MFVVMVTLTLEEDLRDQYVRDLLQNHIVYIVYSDKVSFCDSDIMY